MVHWSWSSWSWIRPYLSIGERPITQQQWDTLKQNGITLIIDLNDDEDEKVHADHMSLKYRGLNVPDVPLSTTTEDFLLAFPQVHGWIESERKVGGKVYLHCTHGQYRSPTCAMAHIIATGGTQEEAVKQVKKSHPPTLYDETSNRALQLWQSQRLTAKNGTDNDQSELTEKGENGKEQTGLDNDSVMSEVAELDLVFDESDVSDVSILDEVRSKLKTHLWFQDHRYHSLILVWVAGTHIHDLFSMYPYLYTTGVKGSGKTTRLGEAIKRLSREGILAGGITRSALFRIINNLHPTLLLDEQEDMSPEMRAVLKTGNDYSGNVIVNDEHRIPTSFSTYCPKVIINTSGLDTFLLDRSIAVSIVKKRDSGTVPIPKGDWKELREKLQLHMHDNQLAVEDEYATLMKSAKARNDEFWAPMIAVARLMGLESDIVGLKISSEKAKELDDDSPERTILFVLQKIVQKKDYYMCKQILPRLVKYDRDYKDWNEKKLGRQLRRMFNPLSCKDTGYGVAYWFDPDAIKRKIEDYGYDQVTSKTSETS